jgi:integrase/recombinase XerD
MLARFQQFIRERQYLSHVSPATIAWYTHAFKWMPRESPTQEQLTDMVIKMRTAGLKATGCNAIIRACNAYLHWNVKGSTKCGAGCEHIRIQKLREPEFVPVKFTDEQVRRLIVFTPRRFFERRLHLLILILLDTGARISEVTGLRVSDIDLDNLLFTLNGKGRKQRKIPFSLLLRKHVYKYIRDFSPSRLLLESKQGDEMGRGTALHEVKRLCRRLGFEPPARTLHAFRHTFASAYIRHGGSVFHLQKTLGHSSLEMSRRYASLCTNDLAAMHAQVSLLS